MSSVLKESLYKKQYKQFEKIKEQSNSFSANFCGHTIIRDSIFEITLNYARKRELSLEVLRFPIDDDELWAFTFIKKGTIFLYINSNLSLCKQIFATAHELYHIHCYAEDMDTNAITGGSLLDSKTVDEVAASQEDLEANAFAGLLLMSDASLMEQFSLFGLSNEMINVDDVLVLMDLFALPYKAVVIRLAESKIITEEIAGQLLDVSSGYVNQRIEITGRAKQWMQNSNHLLHYGSLMDIFLFNRENELLTEERISSDKIYMENLKELFKMKGKSYEQI